MSAVECDATPPDGRRPYEARPSALSDTSFILAAMTRPLSKADQRTIVGDGLAVGCHDIGVTAVTARKLELELSFNHAWRSFPLATSMFRQIKGDLTRCDIVAIIADSPRRRWSRVEWYQEGAWWLPEWASVDVDDVADSLTELYGIERSRWTELAQPLVERLGEDCVQRG